MTLGMEHMTETDVIREATRLLRERGQQGWKIRFGSATGRAGSCSYQTRTLRFSRPLMAARTYQGTLDTVRHEVAHAILGKRVGHGPAWKKLFRELGGTGERCWDADTLVKPEKILKWAYLCAGCRQVLGQSARKRSFTSSRTRCCLASVLTTPINAPVSRWELTSVGS